MASGLSSTVRITARSAAGHRPTGPNDVLAQFISRSRTGISPSPGNSFSAAARSLRVRSSAPPATTSAITRPSSGSGSTMSATPMPITADGIMGCAADSGLCTSTVPPARLTASLPAAESLPMPVSTTTIARRP